MFIERARAVERERSVVRFGAITAAMPLSSTLCAKLRRVIVIIYCGVRFKGWQSFSRLCSDVRTRSGVGVKGNREVISPVWANRLRHPRLSLCL